MNRKTDAKPPLLFISPLRKMKTVGNRVVQVDMAIATQGESGVMTLSYGSFPLAKAARADLLLAGNAHSVPSERLWRAIAECITQVSDKAL